MHYENSLGTGREDQDFKKAKFKSGSKKPKIKVGNSRRGALCMVLFFMDKTLEFCKPSQTSGTTNRQTAIHYWNEDQNTFQMMYNTQRSYEKIT